MSDLTASQLTPEDKRDIGQLLGRTWGWAMTAGVVTFLIGFVVLAWPDETILVVAWLIGLYLLIIGVVDIVRSFTGDRTGGVRALLAIGGVLSVILGVFALRSFTHSVALLAVIIGLAWLINGISLLATAFGHEEFPGRGWAITGGILLILGGLVILVWPAPSLFVLFTFFGIWLVVVGLWEMWTGLRMRSAGGRLRAA